MTAAERQVAADNFDEIIASARSSIFDLGNPGFCLSCGEETDGVEPDARRYRCDWCGAFSVYGAEEIMMQVTPP